MTTGGLLLQQQLQQFLPGIVRRRFSALPIYSGQAFPVFPDLESGAAEIVRERLTEAGDAELLGDGATDIPIVELSMTRDILPVQVYASAYSYTFREFQAFEKAGNAASITALKPMTAMRAIAERVDRYGAFGLPALGVTGFLNDPAVTAVNDTSTALWSLTPDQLRRYIMDYAAQVAESSNGVFDKVNVWVSQPIYSLLVNTRMTDSSQSVMASILGEPEGYVNAIRWMTYLSSSRMVGGQAGKDRIVFAPAEPPLPEAVDVSMLTGFAETAEMHVEPLQLVPEQYWETRKMKIIVPQYMAVGPGTILQPDGFLYVDVTDRP